MHLCLNKVKNHELNGPTISYVRQHADDDVRLLALRGCKDPDVDLTFALQQIQGRQTARRKLPTWAAIDGIVYPPHLNMEQCSSEQTARYKATLCRRLLKSSNSKLLDLTGGFGVDFAFMQEAFDEATYVELNPQLFAVATANFRTLGLNVLCLNTDGVSFLKSLPNIENIGGSEGKKASPSWGRLEGWGGKKASPSWGRLEGALIFLDPARRDDHGQRTYAISDCTPDILALKDELLQKADFVLLKLSPMLDWRKAVNDLGPQNVSEVHIVSVNNECKELLILLQQEAPPYTVYCVNDSQCFTYQPSSFHQTELPSLHPSPITLHQKHLYEPNASIMKAGCFDALAARYALAPLSHDSHLFISPHPIDNFPGRQFLITATSTLNKRDLRTALQGITHANITTRNFPLSAPVLRQRLKLADGGDTYIFATTLADGSHILLICQKP